MTTTTDPYILRFTGPELELIAHALECLALSGRVGFEEVAAFAAAHPEFGLLSDEAEPIAEELR